MADLPPVITSTTTVASTFQASNIVMATMDPDGGNVRIDWTEVEKQAQGSDPYLKCVAQMLIAVRDKNYASIPLK